MIELLVVIAIIGILSAVVLASLNTARSKGNDAAIQSDLQTVQTQAEIYYGDNSNTYSGSSVTACTTAGSLFTDAGVIQKTYTSILGIEGNTAANVACYAATSAYSMAAKLSTGSWWCVDNTGFAGTRATAPTTTGC